MLKGRHLYMTTGKKKKHSFDCMDFCQQSDVSVFEYAV